MTSISVKQCTYFILYPKIWHQVVVECAAENDWIRAKRNTFFMVSCLLKNMISWKN